MWSSRTSGWIYAAQEVGAPLVKIGFTRKSNPRWRLLSLRAQWHVSFVLVGAVYVPYVRRMERAVHSVLASSLIEEEWFYLYMDQARLASIVDTILLKVVTEAVSDEVLERAAALRRDQWHQKRLARERWMEQQKSIL